jgi:hypothetical protein
MHVCHEGFIILKNRGMDSLKTDRMFVFFYEHFLVRLNHIIFKLIHYNKILNVILNTSILENNASISILEFLGSFVMISSP